MCGIYGRVERSGGVTAEALARQAALLAHRGPDDAGTWVSHDTRVGFAHRRLSIIDLSPLGHQPMAGADGRTVITFNGEIYNFAELRQELERAGHAFRSASDTEVLLAAYREWGEACLARLNGMFAFAIHDAGGHGRGPSLFLARDRAGKKPLYYRRSRESFEFASELKAMTGRGGIDLQALNHYLALGYVPGELCLAENVRKLPPGHAARLDIATLELATWRYWSVPANAPTSGADPDALADEAIALLEDSVRLRLVSDVPLAVLLSGGLDSSLVAALAARRSPIPVRTFNIAFPGSPLDESRHAELVARHFGTDHRRIELDRLSLALLDEVAPWVDEPIGDSSLLPVFAISRAMRREVTVALGGDGGDELFGGYSDYARALTDARRWGWLPGPALRAAAAIAATLPAGVRGRNRLASLRGGAITQIAWGSPQFDVALRRRLLVPGAAGALGPAIDAPEQSVLALLATGAGPVDRMTRAHFGSVLPDDFLAKVDRASMAVSLEIRCPFLDWRLVEFCFRSVPDEWKVAGGETRRLEKLIARRLLPPELDIGRKQGFSVPLEDWLRAEPPARLRERLDGLPGIIGRKEVDGLIAGLHAGRANGTRLFSLMMLAAACTNLRLAA